jgi:ABC-type antimicrobial peptide transport system permease subunit
LVVRTEGNPLLLINAIRAQVLSIDLDQSISDVKVMQALYDAGMGPRRLTMVLLGSFAGIALLLAAIGLYGIIAYSVQQRTQEIGIRQALGAQRGDVLRLILSQTMRLVLSGLLVGIAGAFCLTRIMENLLFRVSATDPSAFVAISLLFIAVALAASYIPARRATQIDPMGALRVT